jgi:primosomal replication protein N
LFRRTPTDWRAVAQASPAGVRLYRHLLCHLSDFTDAGHARAPPHRRRVFGNGAEDGSLTTAGSVRSLLQQLMAE